MKNYVIAKNIGGGVIELPLLVMRKLDLREGDIVKFVRYQDGVVVIEKERKRDPRDQ